MHFDSLLCDECKRAEFGKTAKLSFQIIYFIWMYMVKGCMCVCVCVCVSVVGNGFILIRIFVMSAKEQNLERQRSFLFR